jgi:hypothetical protein
MTGGDDGRVRLWSPETLCQTYCLFYHRCQIKALDIDRSSIFGISGGDDGSICLWNLKKKRLVSVFNGHKNQVFTLNFFRENSFFISGSCDETVKIWDIKKKAIVLSMKNDSSVRYASFKKNYFGFLLVTTDGDIKKIQFNNIIHHKKTRKDVWCCRITENILMTGHEDGFIQFVDFQTLAILKTCKAHHDLVNSIDFCKYNKYFVSAGINDFIKLWSMFTFENIRIFKTKSELNFIQVSRNKIFLTGTTPRVRLFDIDTKIEKFANGSKGFVETSIAVSIKLKLIVYGYDRVYLFCLKSMREIRNKFLKYKISSLAFIRSSILCGTFSGFIYLLGIDNLQVKRSFHFEFAEIMFLRTNWNIFVLSTLKKSIFIDMKQNKRLVTHEMRISDGFFNLNCFIFVDYQLNVYIFNEKLTMIERIGSYRIFKFKNSDYLLLKEFASSFFSFIDLKNTKKVLRVKKLKELKQFTKGRNMLMRKDLLILSSLHYDYHINS